MILRNSKMVLFKYYLTILNNYAKKILTEYDWSRHFDVVQLNLFLPTWIVPIVARTKNVSLITKSKVGWKYYLDKLELISFGESC